jgi:hypothetical protein
MIIYLLPAIGLTPSGSSYDTMQPTPLTPFTSDNESHPTEKSHYKIISHLNQPLYQSISDDGDCEFPTLTFWHRNLTFKF